MNEIYSIQHLVGIVNFTPISNRKLTDYALPEQLSVSDYLSLRPHKLIWGGDCAPCLSMLHSPWQGSSTPSCTLPHSKA